MAKPELKAFTPTELFSIHFIPTIIVFLVIMILIGFSWRTATQAVVDMRTEQIQVRSSFVETNIQQRMSVYNNVLRGSAGLFYGSDSVTRNEWFRYVDSLNMEDKLPALLGIGYAELVPASELDAYTARVRAEGFPDFTVTPEEPKRTLYAPVTYIEPFNERNRRVFGGDPYFEQNRREAMDAARDSGAPSMSNVVGLLQLDQTRKNGVTVFYPIYAQGKPVTTVDERRAAIKGFVYVPLRSDVLFGDIFTEGDTNFNFEIYDGTELTADNLLYRRLPGEGGEPFQSISRSIVVVDDKEWTIVYSARNSIVPEGLRERPRSIVIGGLLFALLVAGLVHLLLQRRARQLSDREDRKLEDAKDNMLSLASHQLRTPATGVKQYLGMVLEGFVGDLSQEQKEMLGKAHESNERQLRIINDFLYMAKAGANRIVISPQKLDIGELTRQIVSDMQSNILEAGHKLVIKQRTKTVNVFADPHSARMIIENLISNAIKYTQPGGKITVTVSRQKGGGSVSVEDNGVGIDEKDFEKLFMQFSRIPNELSRQESGSGIGLYLAKYLAEMNGGEILVESELGAGSVFTVILPNKAVRNVTD